MSGLARSALVIDEMMASWRPNILSSRPAAAIWSFILPMPGIMPMMPPMPPIFCIWLKLLGEVVQVELARLHLLGHRRRLFGVDVFGGLLDQRDDVAHAEDAVGDALGMEFLQLVHLFAGADQLDRLAGDGAHRKRRTAAAVAVHAGQHEAGDADALVEVAWRG